MQSTKIQAGMLARAIILLLALMALVTAYYWVHKPFDGATIAIVGGAALDLLTVGVLFAIAGGIGRKLIAVMSSRLALDFTLLSRAEQFALAGALGLMLVAITVLALGMVGLFRNVFFWVPLMVVGALLRRDVRAWLDDARTLANAARPQTRWGWILAAFSVTLLVLALLHSITPPYAWDGMTYHLVGPRQYLADGRMTPQPENFYLGFPKSLEMLFSVTISLFGRDSTAAPIHFGFAVLGLLAVAGLVRRYAENGIEAAWLAVTLLIGSFSLWLIMGWPYVDMAVLALAALAFSLVNLWRETKDPRWLIPLGLTCGFAVGVKYTGGLLAIPLMIYIVVYQPLRNIVQQPHQLIRDGLFFGLPLVLAFLPWMIRGALHYGNPIFPYIFNGLHWDAERAFLFNQVGKGMISLNQGWQLPLLPFTATIFGVDNAEPYGFTVSPWLLPLPFLLLLVWKWVPERARQMAFGGALIEAPIFIFWAVSAANTGIAMQTRLMIVLLPISAVLGALAIDALAKAPDKPVHLSFIVRALFVITLVLSLKDTLTWFSRARVGTYLLGETSREEYLFTYLASYPATMARLGELPDGSQVRFLFDPRSYYCPPEITCIPDVVFDQWSGLLAPDLLPDAVFRQWHERGDDYVLFFRHGYQAYMDFIGHNFDENAILPSALEEYLVEVWTTSDGRYTLYTLEGIED